MIHDFSAFRFALTAFVTLLVVIDPPGLVPIFVGLTQNSDPAEQKRVLHSSVLTAFVIALLFLIGGRLLLSYLGVSINAFSISGGILLFLVAIPMLFGERGGLQSSREGDEAGENVDIAVFPIAIPLITGPGTLTTLLVLAAQARGDASREMGVFVALLAVFFATWLTLKIGTYLLRRFGKGGIHVATRVLGLILAALAVQFVLNGFSGILH